MSKLLLFVQFWGIYKVLMLSVLPVPQRSTAIMSGNLHCPHVHNVNATKLN
jgi:hypothetical protein